MRPAAKACAPRVAYGEAERRRPCRRKIAAFWRAAAVADIAAIHRHIHEENPLAAQRVAEELYLAGARLDALDAAGQLEHMNVPGFNFHRLRGKPVRYSVHVNGPYCVTFGWDGEDAVQVDLEDYH